MNKKIKLLFITNDAVTYGSTRSMLNLVDELEKKNIEIKILIPKHGPLEEELEKRNIEYKVSKYCTWVQSKEDRRRLKPYIKMMCNLFFAIPIVNWVKKEKFDIIHSVNSAVCIGAYISKMVKVIHIWHIRELIEEDHNLKFFNKKYAIKMLNSADKLIYVSKSVENKYKNLMDNNKGKLIYNGIPCKNYTNINIPEVKENNFKILIAGNICKTKGQEDAIRAVELLIQKGINNIELNIAGDGPLEQELKDYVSEKNLNSNIKFLGFIKNLDEIRKQINIYLMCSKKEAFGRVTVEAMMSKNLLIGSNTGGTIEIINDKLNGLLYEQGNYVDLASKIEYAINHWEECKKIIEKAYDDAMSNYSIERCANEVFEIYKELLKNKK